MEDYRNQIETLDADVAALDHKIRRELFDESEGWTNVMQMMKEGGIRSKSSK